MKKSFGAQTLLAPTPVMVIGSYDAEGRPNVMNAAWGGICSSDPPSLAVSIRPGRYTFENIQHTGAFTVNVPSADQVRYADYAGLVSGRTVDKFKETGLTAVPSACVNAPIIQEFPLVIECIVLYTFELGVHVQIVGQIMDVKAEESVLDEAGNVSVAKLAPLCFSPLDGTYYRLGEAAGKAFTVGKPESE